MKKAAHEVGLEKLARSAALPFRFAVLRSA
jgi:hypothetical protein